MRPGRLHFATTRPMPKRTFEGVIFAAAAALASSDNSRGGSSQQKLIGELISEVSGRTVVGPPLLSSSSSVSHIADEAEGVARRKTPQQ